MAKNQRTGARTLGRHIWHKYYTYIKIKIDSRIDYMLIFKKNKKLMLEHVDNEEFDNGKFYSSTQSSNGLHISVGSIFGYVLI